MITDLRGLGWSHMSKAALEVFKSITQVNKNNYPETLRRQYIINAPSIFTMMWKLVSPFLDPSTQDKTSIHGSDYLEILLESIDIENIPSNIGGKGPAVPNGGPYESGESILPGSTPVTVSYGGVHEVEVNADSGSIIAWEFMVESNDIGFGVYYLENGKKVEKIAVQTFNSKEKVEGSLEVQVSGKYILKWDNSYSWVKSKKVFIVVQQHNNNK
eukprot:TRINITY_DN1813_c0_g1_i1.p1 TRINITY_DN1813_c0_g1~~TRINITY_DN1813_c0_g1_i1.p1  ORF type:complete len:215 (+),score=50.31 TRINITY_DN1813_c0_g1_i1:729-1373(+)